MHYCHCICDCENKTEKDIRACHLLAGSIPDCGCMKHERCHTASTTHGMRDTKIYSIWGALKKRCTDKNTVAYKNYGGRGITYDTSWDKFENFYEDMGDSFNEHIKEFGEKDTSIDRVNVDGNYCKENCKWSTVKEQQNNKRTNHYLYYKGKKYTLMELSEEFNILYGTLKSRINKCKWPVDKAVETPIRKRSN